MPTHGPTGFQRIYRNCDRVMLAILALSALLALGLGLLHGQPGLALGLGLPLLGLGVLAYATLAGRLPGRLLLTACQVAMVCLHIQLARGQQEFHFGVFVTLAYLLMYRDWRVVLSGAALFAIHHLLFDRLLAAGLGVYCLAEPDLGRVLMHAGYLLGQTALELWMAGHLRRSTREGLELRDLLQVLQSQGGRIGLDVAHVRASTRTGLKIKEALERLGEALRRVQRSARDIGSASAQIGAGNGDLSGQTEQARSHLGSTAAAVQQLHGTVRHSAESADQARQLADQACDVARQGEQAVTQVVQTMSGIQQASTRIADIIAVIDGIAFQTNILALNAAVEAARAGEQGRGFAVVAGEVRNLAQRSAQAAREIKSLIQSSVEQVQAGSSLVQGAGQTMGQIQHSVQRVSQLIVEMADAAQQQHRGFEQIAASVSQLEQATEHNAVLVQQSSAAAQQLDQQAHQLQQVVGAFQLGASGA